MAKSIELAVVGALACMACPKSTPAPAAPVDNANPVLSPSQAALLPSGDDVALASMCTEDPPENSGRDASLDTGADATEAGSALTEDGEASNEALQRRSACKGVLRQLPGLRWAIRRTGAWHIVAKTPEWQQLRRDAQAFHTCRGARQPEPYCGPLHAKMLQDRLAVRHLPQYKALDEQASWLQLKARAQTLLTQQCFNTQVDK